METEYLYVVVANCDGMSQQDNPLGINKKSLDFDFIYNFSFIFCFWLLRLRFTPRRWLITFFNSLRRAYFHAKSSSSINGISEHHLPNVYCLLLRLRQVQRWEVNLNVFLLCRPFSHPPDIHHLYSAHSIYSLEYCVFCILTWNVWKNWRSRPNVIVNEN